MSTRKEVYAVIDGERDYQTAMSIKAHGYNRDPQKALEEFLLYMHDYMNEAIHVASRTWGPEANWLTLDVIRKVVAIGVGAMEAHGAIPRTAPTKHEHGSDLVKR